MLFRSVSQSRYSGVEFGEDVLQMLKSILGNIGLVEMKHIEANMDYHETMHEFYKLLSTVK